ncbi:MAG: hypothetical protein JJO33_00250 [Escherichia coli]|nr:hypothetical protein [Escherichia coli]
MQYVKYLMVILAFILGLALGESIEEKRNQEILLEEQRTHLTELKSLQERKDATINLLLKDMATADAVQSAIDKRVNRLQYNINAGNKAIMQHTDRAYAESIIQCRNLLSEGAELHGEGVKILRDTNRRLEAIINIHKEQNSP